jgi:cytochrome c-type biogenesis protein CcmH/NrfF
MGLGESPFHEWRKYLAWALPLFAAALLGLLVLGVLARRHKKKQGL